MSKNKSFADDGWALWIEGDDVSSVYINDWLSPGGKSFVDLAVRIRSVRLTRNMFIYVPFPVEKEDVTDLAHLFKDRNVIRAIFSSPGIIDYKKNDVTSEIAYNGRTIDLVHLSETEFSVEPLSTGALIKLDLSSLIPHLDTDEAYFIFRMPHKTLDGIFKPRVNVGNLLERLRDLITSPVITEKYGYSIRINESRLLPPEINRIGTFHRQKLKKAVVTISLDESYELNHSNCYRIRRLEQDLYRDYAPKGFGCEDAITYQWTENRENNYNGHFNFYFDIARNSISKVSMLVYMVLLMLVGIAGGALWDLIKFLIGIL